MPRSNGAKDLTPTQKAGDILDILEFGIQFACQCRAFETSTQLNSVQPETLSGLSGATHIQYREAETNLTFMSVAGQILKHATLMLYAGSRAAKQL